MLATIELQSAPAPQLADLVKVVTKNGEIALTDGGNIVAKLAPIAPVTRATLDDIVTIIDKVVPAQPDSKARFKRRFGRAKGMLEMSSDFDAPLDELKDYL